MPSSKTDLPPEAPTDAQVIPNSQSLQTDQAKLSNEDLELGTSKDPLDAYDWAELEDWFHANMERCADRESGIQKEFNELLYVNLLLPAFSIRTEMYE